MPWYDDVPREGGEAPPPPPPARGAAQAAPAVENGGRTTMTVHPAPWYNNVPRETEAPLTASDIVGPVGGTEAAVRGAADAVTFGAAPAIMGLSAAGAAPTAEGKEQEQLPMVGEFPGLEIPALGAVRLFRNDKAAHEAYKAKVQEEEQRNEASFAQHPILYGTGVVGGSMLTPGFGVGMPAEAATVLGRAGIRAGRGVIGGAVGGGLYGGGRALSEGEPVAPAVAEGATLGAVTGGVLGPAVGALGPRVMPRPAATPTERAAEYAVKLRQGAGGLPQGFETMPSVAAPMMSAPGGSQITRQVRELQTAAGGRVKEISGEMGKGVGRVKSDQAIRDGLEDSIKANEGEIRANYAPLDAKLSRDTVIDLPRTRAMAQKVVDRRSAAAALNPEAGLEQVINAVTRPEQITIDGARDLRSTVSRMGSRDPHPEISAQDYNAITNAIRDDMREAAAKAGASKEFAEAEAKYGPLAEENRRINDILRSTGEGALETLEGMTGARGGDARMIERLSQIMPKEKFQQLGAAVLNRLGASPATGEFSLAKFVTEFNKMSPEAKKALFPDPQHLSDIENIVNLGEVTKKGLESANTSKTANALIVTEVVWHGIEGLMGLAAGYLSPFAAATAVAGFTGNILFTRWLSRPSSAASLRAFGIANQGMVRELVSRGVVSPGRLATFKIATRNLAHTLGVPEEKILGIVHKTYSAIAPQSAEQPAQAQTQQ